jgi:hypothetical protein
MSAKPWQDEKAVKLLEAMLKGAISEIKPQFDPRSELGFSFPQVKQLLQTTDKELMAIIEALSQEGILERKFFDKFLYCPQCGSPNLSPIYSCPQCGSGNIIRGRVLEHVVCKYTGTEDEFLLRGRLLCPKCKQELHTLDRDYRSLGVLYKCRQCGEIFNQPHIKWRCLKCSSITAGEKVSELNVYSYSLNQGKRNWLKFELQPKARLIQLLQSRGYEIREGAKMQGKSGAEHSFDILASRDEGIIAYYIAIGVEIAANAIGIDRVFNFDDKAYDVGLHDKVLIALPGLTPEAREFAARQRIRVLESLDLERFLAQSILPQPALEAEAEVERKPLQFKSRSDLANYFRSLGYEVKENTQIAGRSGAEHQINILASKDDGIMIHRLIIGIEVSDQPIGIGRVFDFDDKAYDSGIMEKILVAVPGLTEEASRFAQRQGVRVFEAETLELD